MVKDSRLCFFGADADMFGGMTKSVVLDLFGYPLMFLQHESYIGLYICKRW